MNMPEPRLTRYDVTFTVSAPVEGRPLITLTLSQDGVPVAEQSPVFFLEPTEEVEPDEAVLMARFLSNVHCSLRCHDANRSRRARGARRPL